MFDALSDRLGGIFDGLTGRGALSEKDRERCAARNPCCPARKATSPWPWSRIHRERARRAVGEESSVG